jgi:8-oxo-dGTP diphosphatase
MVLEALVCFRVQARGLMDRYLPRTAMDLQRSYGRVGSLDLPDTLLSSAHPLSSFLGREVRMKYVVGFMFNEKLTRVALIKKLKPAWQKGKLNGIGGKLNGSESPLDAMVREFKEETGMDTFIWQWRRFLDLSGVTMDSGPFHVACYASHCENFDFIRSVTKEEIVKVYTNRIDVAGRNYVMIDNLPWIIGLAMDNLHDYRPRFVSAHYGEAQ